MEADFLLRLAACLDPKSPTTAGIVKRAYRAMNPHAGKSMADKRARSALLAKMKRSLKVVPPGERILPPFDEKWGRPPGAQVGIQIPMEYFRRFGEKVARGIYFMDDGTYIERPLEIRVFPDVDLVPQGTVDDVKRSGKVYAIEPGVTVYRQVATDDPNTSILLIEIWEVWSVLVTVADETPIAPMLRPR